MDNAGDGGFGNNHIRDYLRGIQPDLCCAGIIILPMREKMNFGEIAAKSLVNSAKMQRNICFGDCVALAVICGFANKLGSLNA